MQSKSTKEMESGSVLKRGRLRKTNQQGSLTIERITQAAKDILASEGAGQFSVERVARRAGVTKGTLLYHFQSKTDLAEFLMRQYVGQLRTELEQGKAAVLQTEGNLSPANLVLEVLVRWHRSFLEKRQTSVAFGVNLLMLATSDERVRKPLCDWYEELFEIFRTEGDIKMLREVLTLQGIFFLRHFGIAPLCDKEFGEVLDNLS